MLKRWFASHMNARWLAGGVAAVVLALVAARALFVPAADWLAHHDVGSAKGSLLETARDNARGRLLTHGAGLFAAGAVVFTARNFTLSRGGQVTDRYTKAIEQLGSKDLDVRIGGIYALDRVARDSARDHPTVMEVLTAFIRERSPVLEQPADPRSKVQERFTRPDVQAAVSVVGRRDVKRDIRSIHLDHADLSGADLTHAHLNGAYLRFADLTAADLNGAHLNGAHLRGAQLNGAALWDAQLNGARLFGADLTAANLNGARLHHAKLTGAKFVHADLASADLTGANLRKSGLTDVIWPTNVPARWAGN